MSGAEDLAGLRVGLIAPPWVPVPPTVYGGAELVIDLLARGLQDAGCDVLLFTTGDATCPVPRRSLYPRALGTAVAPLGEQAHVVQAYRELSGVDIIHDHTLVGPVLVKGSWPGMPVVTTAHGEFTPNLRAHYASAAANGVAVVAISHAQRHSVPEIPTAAVIHHGIDPDAFPAGRGDGGYVLFLGRMSPDKGPHRAIEIARAAGERIILAAKMWEPDEQQYFKDCVEPLLGPDAIYVGEVGGHRKLDLLAGAKALVNPIRWPEPFGLVMIEALACGTPVLSFPEGAAPEIIDHASTGFLCTDEDDMVAHLGLAGDLNRADCRSSVRARFSAARMVHDHLDLYGRLVAGRSGTHVDLTASERRPPAPDSLQSVG